MFQSVALQKRYVFFSFLRLKLSVYDSLLVSLVTMILMSSALAGSESPLAISASPWYSSGVDRCSRFSLGKFRSLSRRRSVGGNELKVEKTR